MTQNLNTFSRYQKFVVAMLAFLQFTIVLDFMILSPLGALLIPALSITPAQFGLVVSTYAFSAGISGLLAAGFADRFDRKKLLLFFYTGFVVGTLLCGMATTYRYLLFARMITGLFGGVIGSIVMAIVTDLFPLSMRGRVMGVVQTAFAASQVLGIPLGLYFSNLWGWHAPFIMIVVVSIVAGVLIFTKLQPINAHLALKNDRSAFTHFFKTLSKPRYVQAFAATALLSIGGFMIMPFSSAFTVHNIGIDLAHLPMVYMITGLISIVTGPLIGRMSDKIGKFATFVVGTVITIGAINVYTRLGITPLSTVVMVNAILFVGIMARMISSSALTSAVPAPTDRGAFMAVSASIQQISGGIASAAAGLIVAQDDAGRLLHFDTLGLVVSAAAIVNLVLLYYISAFVKKQTRQNAAAMMPPSEHI